MANPLNIHLSGRLAKLVTRAYHLYALPSAANRVAVLFTYLSELFFARPVVSLGVAPSSIARFSASEEFASPTASDTGDYHPGE